jgi:Rps23 Pro-64 3,4-dihydroxylase Tpa1-like proline 4-hydroxylase
MKQDASWTMVSASYNPLELYRLIKQVVLKQTKEQYPFAAVHQQSLAMLNTKQGGLSNTQWYERFNTQHDIAHSVGVELGHKVLWEYCTQLKHSTSYDALGTTDQAAMRQAAEDQYLVYILLVNSSEQHDHLRKELQNNFTKGSNKYPENCSQTLLFLDRYSKLAPADSALQGTAFAQKGGDQRRGKKRRDPTSPKQ